MNSSYIDIDGVILGRNDPQSSDVALARHAQEFLEFCLQNYRCYWRTTHSRDGSIESIIAYLYPYMDAQLEDLVRQIQPAEWDFLKTDAIDFDQDFYWIEDQILSGERDQLIQHGKLDSYVFVDTRKEVVGLRRVGDLVGSSK